MSIHACLAPGLAPGKVRLVRMAAGTSETETLAELSPENARHLASALLIVAKAADAADKGE